MKRVIGMDIHRTFAAVVVGEHGRLRRHGRVDMTRAGLEGFGRSLAMGDEVVVDRRRRRRSGNAMAVVRVLGPYVARVIVADHRAPERSIHPRSGQRRRTPAGGR
jgi:hypothetical protein